NLGRLIEPGRDNHVVRPDRLAAINLDDVVVALVALDTRNARAEAHWKAACEPFQSRNDFLLWHEAVRVFFPVAHTGKARLPARRVQREGIPAVIAPGFR